MYDSVLNAFPGLRNAMLAAQEEARRNGYVETILGRRRHLPDMTLPEFEFVPAEGYVIPDIDPLDPSTLTNKSTIPDRVVKALQAEFKQYKYFGQIVKRTRELADNDHIRVINNRGKIQDATRQCLNCVDFQTEILTTHGWKRYDDISIGDEVLSYNLTSQKIEKDRIEAIHVNDEITEVVNFKSSTFDSCSTLNHRWVVGEAGEAPRVKFTSNIYSNKWPDYPILRVGDNDFVDNPDYSEDHLRLLGWIMTDGSYGGDTNRHYRMEIFQHTRKQKNLDVYQAMIDVLGELGIEYTDHCSAGYHSIYLKKCEFTSRVLHDFPDRTLTWDFVNTLSQRQAGILMWSMIEGDGTLGTATQSVTFTCSSTARRDIFQYLAFRAGYATSSYTIDPSDLENANLRIYDSVSNKEPVCAKNPYYTITVLRVKRAHIYPNHKSKSTVVGVWCVTTHNGTWIARRNGKVYITGNSKIQGSAAEQTKMAMLMLENDSEWQKIGGRLILPVHDELIAEVPIRYYEEGGRLLSALMCKAAEFLPFPSKCDVTTMTHWYGLEFPCPYSRPASLDNLSEDEIRWVQYYLVQSEYQLPTYKDAEGNKPRGDAAKGVNGVWSDAVESAIEDYIKRMRISRENFIDFIENRVIYGSQAAQNR